MQRARTLIAVAAGLGPVLALALAAATVVRATDRNALEAAEGRSGEPVAQSPPRAPGPGVGSLLSLRFEENRGQTNSDAAFVARLPGATARAMPTGIGLSLAAGGKTTELAVAFDGGDPGAAVAGAGAPGGPSHYLIGADPSQWITDVPTWSAVRFKRIYPGIDAVAYGTEGRLEYDFVVAPGADPGRIRLRFDGADGVALTPQGDLDIDVGGRRVVQHAPVAYQGVGDERRAVAADYVIGEDGRVAVHLGAYDPTREVVVDPTLGWSSALPGNGSELGFGVTVDALRNVWVTGYSNSTNVPGPGGTLPQGWDAFVVKAAPSGAVQFVTYIGGTASESGSAIAVDAAGSVHVAGYTTSTDFPATTGAIQTVSGMLPGAPSSTSQDAFYATLDATGTTLLYATYLGGSTSDYAASVAVDGAGNAYVAGHTWSDNFPGTPVVARGLWADAWVVQVTPSGGLGFAATYGGTKHEFVSDMTRAPNGDLWLVGRTDSTNFPTTPGALQPTFRGGFGDGYVMRLNSSGAMLHASYVGGAAYDDASSVALDIGGGVVVGGTTQSGDFPTTGGAFRAGPQGASDGFVCRLTANGALTYSSFVGGVGVDEVRDLVVGSGGELFLTGTTTSGNFPVTADAYQSVRKGAFDAFLAVLDPSGTCESYGTYVGGRFSRSHPWDIALEPSGRRVWVTGQASFSFPITPGGVPLGANDGFLLRFDFPLPVRIDIRPGNAQSSLNLKSKGKLPVAIYGAADLDATTIDAASVTLAGVGVATKGNGSPMASLTDVDGDGRIDLLLHFDLQALGLQAGTSTLTLRGSLSDGTPIEGSATVNAVP